MPATAPVQNDVPMLIASSSELKNSPNMIGCSSDPATYAQTRIQPSHTPTEGRVASHIQVSALPAEGRRLFITAKDAAGGSIATVTARNTHGATGPVIPSIRPKLKYAVSARPM